MTLRIALTSAVLAAITSIASSQPKPAPTRPATSKVTDVEAGPLFDQAEAAKKCPTVCKAPATWNGTWRTTKPGVMSVCQCAEPAVAPTTPPPPPPTKTPPGTTTTTTTTTVITTTTTTSAPPSTPPPSMVMVKGAVRDVEAGPLFDQTEASTRCPTVCAAPAKWNGRWRTVKAGIQSVCACEDPPTTVPAGTVTQVGTGFIKNTAGARKVCAKACTAPWRWNGEWRAKGKKATCDCVAVATPVPPTKPVPTTKTGPTPRPLR